MGVDAITLQSGKGSGKKQAKHRTLEYKCQVSMEEGARRSQCRDAVKPHGHMAWNSVPMCCSWSCGEDADPWASHATVRTQGPGEESWTDPRAACTLHLSLFPSLLQSFKGVSWQTGPVSRPSCCVPHSTTVLVHSPRPVLLSSIHPEMLAVLLWGTAPSPNSRGPGPKLSGKISGLES